MFAHNIAKLPSVSQEEHKFDNYVDGSFVL